MDGAPTTTGYTSREKIIIAHGATGGLLTMVVWPLLAVIGRYLRSYYPRWVRIHYIVAIGLSVPLLVVTFALGRYHRGSDDNWTTYHFRAAIVLLLLGLLQPIYGSVIHIFSTNVPYTGAKSILRYGHPVIGILMIALGFAQVKTGFDSWDKPGDMVTHGSLIAWGVLFALWSVVYLAGLALIPSQWSAQKTLVGVGKKDDSYEVGNGTRGSNAALTSGEA